MRHYQGSFTQARQQVEQRRRDKGPQTPTFRLTDADIARLMEVHSMCRRYGANPAASFDLELEYMHRAFYYQHRPILGVPNSLNATGDIAFDADWKANREAHMAEAYGAWDRASVELDLAA